MKDKKIFIAKVTMDSPSGAGAVDWFLIADNQEDARKYAERKAKDKYAKYADCNIIVDVGWMFDFKMLDDKTVTEIYEIEW